MGKTAFVWAFSLVLFLSISRSAFGTDDAESIFDQISQAASDVKDAIEPTMSSASSDLKETMQSMSTAIETKMENAQESSGSWGDWFSDMISKVVPAGNQKPEIAAGPAHTPTLAPAQAPIVATLRGMRVG